MVWLSNSNSSTLSSPNIQLYNTSCEMLKRYYFNVCILAPGYTRPPPPSPEICFLKNLHTYCTWILYLGCIPWPLHNPLFPSVVHELIGRIILQLLLSDGLLLWWGSFDINSMKPTDPTKPEVGAVTFTCTNPEKCPLWDPDPRQSSPSK